MKHVNALALMQAIAMAQEDKMRTVCWQCGKPAPVNTSGVCEACWIKYAHLRENE